MVLTDPRRADPRVARPGDPAWVRALFIAPAVVGSFAALILLGKTKTFRWWLGRRAAGNLEAVRASIVGQTQRRVTALLGPPPAATSSPTVTWYYPVAASRRTAMAVSFEGDCAARVDFFTAPQ